MARPRKPVTLSLSAHQALYVLEKAIFDRKLTAADVDHYVASMHHEISSIQERLARLKEAVVGPVKRIFGGDMPFPGSKQKGGGGEVPVPHSTKKNAGGDPPFPTKKRKQRVTAAVKASRQLQGQYISALRGVAKSRRATFQKIAKEEGREKAIAVIKLQAGK
jgi:hypothetical protein